MVPGRAWRPCSAHYKFRAQYVIRQRIITGQQRQQRRGVGAQQTISSFIVQQQVAEAF